MNIFKKLSTYSELEEEVKFYSRENFMKQRRIESLQKEIRELKKELEKKKGEKDGRKTTRAKHNSGNKSSSRTRSK